LHSGSEATTISILHSYLDNYNDLGDDDDDDDDDDNTAKLFDGSSFVTIRACVYL